MSQMRGYNSAGGDHDFYARNAAGQIWNGAAFVAWADADYASYRIPATAEGASGWFQAIAPVGSVTYELRVRGASLAASYVVWTGENDVGGNGVNAIYVHVTAAGNNVPGASVRFVLGGITTGGPLLSNGAGLAGPFSLDDGDHQLLVSKGGYIGHAETATIAADATLDVALVGYSIDPPADPEFTTAHCITRDGSGAVQPNVTISFRLVGTTTDANTPGDDGFSYGRNFTATSDANGVLQIGIRRSSRYVGKRGRGTEVPFTTGADPTFEIPEILAGTNDGPTV